MTPAVQVTGLLTGEEHLMVWPAPTMPHPTPRAAVALP